LSIEPVFCRIVSILARAGRTRHFVLSPSALRPDKGKSNHAAPTQVLGAGDDGRRSFGAISSVLDPFNQSGLGLGAPCAGIAFDHAGDCQTNFTFFFASYVVSAVLIFLVRRPQIRMPSQRVE